MRVNTLSAQLAQLAQGQTSAVELASEALSRAEVAQRHFNAFSELLPDAALAQAQEADRRRQAGQGGLLLGVPLVVKDLFSTLWGHTRSASAILESYRAPFEAHVISQLRQAGAVIVAKTNQDEFAMGSSNEHSVYGPVLNPWDITRVPGGSSGGSAVAVASGVVAGALGSDTGGSIRQPAALCGICGIKPTYGLCSRFGMVAYASSLDQAGPMATSAEDLALLLEAMAGFDPRDATSVNRPVPPYSQLLGQTHIQGLRLGVPREFFAAGLAPEIRHKIEAAIALLEQGGAKVVEVSLPRLDKAIAAYYILACAEASSNLARFDGVRYGRRAAEVKDLNELYQHSRSQGFGAEVKRRILLGTFVLSHGYYDAYYLKAQQVRRLIAEDFARAFEQVDLLVGPTTPTTAFAFDDQPDDPLALYLADIYTVAVNLAGLPALSLPVGFDSNQLPIGMQLMGPAFSEERLLGLAHSYQQLTDFHLATPEKPRQRLFSVEPEGQQP